MYVAIKWNFCRLILGIVVEIIMERRGWCCRIGASEGFCSLLQSTQSIVCAVTSGLPNQESVVCTAWERVLTLRAGFVLLFIPWNIVEELLQVLLQSGDVQSSAQELKVEEECLCKASKVVTTLERSCKSSEGRAHKFTCSVSAI